MANDLLSGRRSWPAPAKINWFLSVTGRRADGYHELQTAFQFLSLHDSLTFVERGDGAIERLNDVPGILPRDDLVIRAAHALKEAAHAPQGVGIRLTKRIPSGAGLGGGSSEAATTLVALNAIWGTGLSNDALAEIGLSLGADVPIFVRGGSAWAEGVGEILTPIRLPEAWMVVIYPACHVATAEVFRAPQLTRNSVPRTIPRFLRADASAIDPEQVLGIAANDCEPVVRELYPEVGNALDWLAQFASVRMTGTGSAVFGVFPSQSAAQAVETGAPPEWQVFVTRAINTSPLQDLLNSAEGAELT
ncbi:MAG: 4-(cytidine 5'-diphospho)-2-C-methyl-D-erythritol kinase [Gammaproteobacteria bacterium]|nr:4-(cytidine 5'-diphospho)-2-C-methyl-D-erythritol kinase [Gammaproteobacteria bacterium]